MIAPVMNDVVDYISYAANISLEHAFYQIN